MLHLWWTKGHWDRFPSQYFGFSPMLHTHLQLNTPLLSEGQMGETWQPPDKQALSDIRELLDRKVLPYCLKLQVVKSVTCKMNVPTELWPKRDPTVPVVPDLK
jgi:hypothetical protein